MKRYDRSAMAGDQLAVVSQSGPTVSFFDAADDRCLGTVETLAEPHELCFDPTHRLLWCTTSHRSGYYHANAGRRTEVTVIDPDNRRIVEVINLAPEHGPHGLALDALHDRLYVSAEGSARRCGGRRHSYSAGAWPDRHHGAWPALVRDQPGRHDGLREQQGGPFPHRRGSTRRHADPPHRCAW